MIHITVSLPSTDLTTSPLQLPTTTMAPVHPATSTTGFFQPEPVVANQWTEDRALRRSAELFLSPADLYRAAPLLDDLGRRVLSRDVMAAFVNAETNPPHISGDGFSTFGKPKGADALVTSAGWKYLQDFGWREGIVATGNEAEFGAAARVVQAFKVHLFSASSAMVVCPSGMQDGAITCLRRELATLESAQQYSAQEKRVRKQVFESALGHLMNRNPELAWSSGQWMTERVGGSDVRGTETFAERAGPTDATDIDGLPLGPWTISGFKFFSSATDCGCSIILAYTPKGLSCFFAPTRRVEAGTVVMNGIKIQRLKNKLGTHALPTAELELKGMRAHLLGEEGRGVSVIANVLNVARFHNSARAVGYLGRGLGVARAFSRVRRFPSRKPGDDLLRSIPLFARTLSMVTLRHRADTLLAGFLASLLGTVNTGSSPNAVVPGDAGQAALLLRLLTSVCKAYITKHSVAGLQECMEALGGIGYLENNETPAINVACMFRDANVFCIWEGTTDVLSTDTVKVLRGRQGPACTAALDTWLVRKLGSGGAYGTKQGAGLPVERAAVKAAWKRFQALPGDMDDMLPMARDVVKRVGDIVCAALLIIDAERDEDPVAVECARRFVAVEMVGSDVREQTQREITHWDRRIAFEGDEVAVAKL